MFAARWRGWGAIAAIALTGCDASVTVSSDLPPTNAPSPPPPLPSVQSGVFKDSNVGGLTYRSGEEQGITGPDGCYTCVTGMDVTFSVGRVIIGSAPCASLVVPPSLVASGTLADLQVLNIARFLRMLDLDGEPANGIEISEPVREVAAAWGPVDFTTADLDAELVAIRSDAASVDGTPHPLPAPTAALQHFEDSLACAYAGAFAGPFAGDYSGGMVMTVGSCLLGLAFLPAEFEWFAVDARNEVILSGGGQPSVELSSHPTLEQPGSIASTALAGLYLTPDRISGTWEIAHQDRRGTFDLARLGSDAGAFRFVGRMGAFRQDGVITLSLDNGFVTGEVFEAFRGRRAQVNGTLEGDIMHLDVTGQILAAVTGAVVFDQDCSPLNVPGPWGSMGEFRAVACRLN